MSNKIKTYTYSVIALAVLLSGLRIGCIFGCFDAEVGYFDTTLAVTIMRWLFVVSAVWISGVFLFLPAETSVAEATGSIASRAVNYAGAVLFFASGFGALFGEGIGAIVTGLLLIVSALYFALSGIEAEKRKTARSYLVFAVIISLISILVRIYFNFSVTTNSPFKVLLQIGLMSSMLFLLSETRILLGRALPRLGFATALLCILCALPAGICNLVAWFAGVGDSYLPFVTTPFFALPLLAVVALAIVRCFTYSEAPAPSETDETSSARE